MNGAVCSVCSDARQKEEWSIPGEGDQESESWIFCALLSPVLSRVGGLNPESSAASLALF